MAEQTRGRSGSSGCRAGVNIAQKSRTQSRPTRFVLFMAAGRGARARLNAIREDGRGGAAADAAKTEWAPLEESSRRERAPSVLDPCAGTACRGHARPWISRDDSRGPDGDEGEGELSSRPERADPARYDNGSATTRYHSLIRRYSAAEMLKTNPDEKVLIVGKRELVKTENKLNEK